MAVELGTFISDQLKKLPSNHPDRPFLEGMVQVTQSYIQSSYAGLDNQPKEQTIYPPETMDLLRLGNVLKSKREELGIPAIVLARKAHISRSTIWTVERGENPKTGKPSKPGKDKLERWIQILRFSPEEQGQILTLSGYQQKPSTSKF